MGEWDEVATQIRGFAFDGADLILIADANRAHVSWLWQALGTGVHVEHGDHSRRVFERLTADPPRILVVGTDLADLSGTVLLAHAARYALVGPHHGPIVFLMSDSPNSAPDVDEQQVPVFYRLTPALQPERVRELFQMAMETRQRAAPEPAQDPVRARQVIEHAKRFAVQSDLKGGATVAQAAIVDVCRADRARVLYFDDDSSMLWCELEAGSEQLQASAGLAGFVVRTGGPLKLERAGLDPSYRPDVDDPAGNGNERIALCPVRDRDRKIHAVLVALRNDTSPPFDDGDLRLLESLAEAWGPYIHQLALDADAREANPGAQIFRDEALGWMVRRGHQGDVVRINPGWMSGSYWVLLGLLVSAGVFGYFVQIHQYSEGPGAVKVTGRGEVISFDPGTVTSVEVVDGQLVKAGQVLARLHDSEQAVKLRGLQADYERKLVAYLQAQSDPATRQALGQIVTDLNSATANVDARVLRAPYDGKVKDVRVRTGQRVEAGAVAMSISKIDQPEGLVVLAFLPGSDRPRLRANQPLRLTLSGYRGVHFDMKVRAISSEVLGGQEALSRFLGDRFKESVQTKTAVVVVEGTLPSSHFESDGEAYELHDGMIGQVEVQLDSRSVLQTIIPGLDL